MNQESKLKVVSMYVYSFVPFRDVAEAIIKSSKWKFALRNHTVEQNGKETTPFRKLIQRMPGNIRS